MTFSQKLNEICLKMMSETPYFACYNVFLRSVHLFSLMNVYFPYDDRRVDSNFKYENVSGEFHGWLEGLHNSKVFIAVT